MFLINTLMEDISVGTAGLVALLGYARRVYRSDRADGGHYDRRQDHGCQEDRACPPLPLQQLPLRAPAPKAAPALATGTAGECKLYNVGDREAAMLMAIVANKLGKPLNTLRFKSMKEVI